MVSANCTFSQTCNCESNFDWLRGTFEENDAGYRDAIERKGVESYRLHCEIYVEMVKTADSAEHCVEILRNWLRYFRAGHLRLSLVNDEAKFDSEIQEADIRSRYLDWERLDLDSAEFFDHLSEIVTPSLEGVWKSEFYTIGVKRVHDEYIGFIIEADGIYWMPSQVKFRLGCDGEQITGLYYMKDHSERRVVNGRMVGINYLDVESAIFRREFPKYDEDRLTEIYFRGLEGPHPFFEVLSDRTALLRIPTFDQSMKESIDSVISVNRGVIGRTENLIIDLRGNGGGSDACFQEIIPIMYTSPIKTVGVEYLSTELNNKRMESMANDRSLSRNTRKWARKSLSVLNANLGKYVNLQGVSCSVTERDSVFLFPKNIGVVVDGGCASSTEQFLLAAKQSQKVKLFGSSTFGSLDFSNMYTVQSPCDDIELGYCLSRSLRLPGFVVDGVGVQPDYYIDDSIEKHEWNRFVVSVMED